MSDFLEHRDWTGGEDGDDRSKISPEGSDDYCADVEKGYGDFSHAIAINAIVARRMVNNGLGRVLNPVHVENIMAEDDQRDVFAPSYRPPVLYALQTQDGLALPNW